MSVTAVRRLVWGGFVLQGVGLAIDGAWHATHPEGEMAPFWAHLPIHLGILVLAIGVLAAWRAPAAGPRPIRYLGVVAAGATLQVIGDAWSLAVQAEANDFYVPAALIAVGGVTAFAALVLPLVQRWRRSGARRSVANAT